MFTMTRIALVATLVAASSTLALAEFDPNLGNRYPAYAGGIGAAPLAHHTLRSAPVQLHQGRNATVEFDRTDRASSPYAGGGF
jgi:hypothetical protein